MAPAPHPSLPLTAQLRHSTHFDPWNSSSAGHQVGENRSAASSSGWRRPHATKLNHQYRSGGVGGPRISDPLLVARGPRVGDGDREGMRAGGVAIIDMLRYKIPVPTPESTISSTNKAEKSPLAVSKPSSEKNIFTGCNIYINGSTHPLISDHKLKHLLAAHGATLSTHLEKRKVTHVVLGKGVEGKAKKSGGRGIGMGIGGGMAAGKIEREIQRVRGWGGRFVGVEWVLESVKKGIRLPEAGFKVLKVAAKGQGSVYERSGGGGGHSLIVSKAG